MKRIKIIAWALCGLAIVPMAAAGVIEDIDLEAGLELGDFHYRESHFMREDGVQFGAYGSIAVLAARPWYFQFFMSMVGGDVEYDGGYQGGGSLKGDTGNSIFNFRGIAGYMLEEGSLLIMPYSGIGYRFLRNDLDDLPGGYRRDQTYFYFPFGVDIALPVSDDGSWTIGLKTEFDWMFYGFNKSGGTKLDNQDGWGFRLTPYARWNIDENIALKLELFGEYWKINDSDVNKGIMEPENASNYYGARGGICF